MKILSLAFALLCLSLMLPIAVAQGSNREVVTAENVDEVQLLAAAGWHEGLHVFDIRSDSSDKFNGPWWPAWTIAFNQDGSRLALGNDNNEVILFDVIDEPPFIVEDRVLRAHEGPVYSLAFHPNGTHLASGGSDGMIYMWDIESGELARTMTTEPRSAVYGLTFSPDGTQLHCGTFAGRGDVSLSMETSCVAMYNEIGPVYSVAFSPDGALFAYGDTVLNGLTLHTVRTWFDRYTSSRSKLVFSADGTVLLNGAMQQDAYVWHLDRLADGIRLREREGLLALSPDGTLVAGGNLVIHDSRTGEELASLEPPDVRYPDDAYFANLPRDAVFSPDGTLIVTASVDGILRFWGVSAD